MKSNGEKNLSRKSSTPRIGLGLILAIMLFLLAGCKNASDQPQPTATTPVSSIPVVQPVVSYADVVDRASPAVVTIRSARRVRAPQQYPFHDDPFFQFIPRPQQPPREYSQRGLGSGVIVNTDGYIVTNHHVIDGAEDIQVVTNSNQSFDAKVVGSDAPSDLAVLKIEAQSLPVLILGDSDKVRVGDVALAIGSPLGLTQTVTAGIISAKGRSTGVSDGSFEDFLQTDAPINQGNSGGALINANGELIGINSQILSPSGGNIGIGFAIPSNMTRNIMQQLIQNGRVWRGRLGVVIKPVTSDIAAKLGLSQISGLVVREVEKDGPAEQAGIRPGDIILAFNGTPVSDGNSLRNHVAETQPGTEVPLTIFRDGREQQMKVTLGEFIPASVSSY